MEHIPNSTLDLIDLAKMCAVFIFVEEQSVYMARALASSLKIPFKTTLRQEINKALDEYI